MGDTALETRSRKFLAMTLIFLPLLFPPLTLTSASDLSSNLPASEAKCAAKAIAEVFPDPGRVDDEGKKVSVRLANISDPEGFQESFFQRYHEWKNAHRKDPYKDPYNFSVPELEPTVVWAREQLQNIPYPLSVRQKQRIARLMKQSETLEKDSFPYEKTLKFFMAFANDITETLPDKNRMNPIYRLAERPIEGGVYGVRPLFTLGGIRRFLDRGLILFPTHKLLGIETMNRLYYFRILPLGIAKDLTKADAGYLATPRLYRVHDWNHAANTIGVSNYLRRIPKRKIREFFKAMDSVPDPRKKSVIEAILFIATHEGNLEINPSLPAKQLMSSEFKKNAWKKIDVDMSYLKFEKNAENQKIMDSAIQWLIENAPRL